MDEAVQDLKEIIASNDLRKLAIHLAVQKNHATGSPEMIALLESLLDDRRLCTISIPVYIGEIRYLAALALHKERKKAGIKVPMEIEVVFPLTPIEIGRLADQYGIKSLDTLEEFRQLIALNVVEMVKFSI